MSELNLNALKTWFTDDENVFETIAQQRRDESPMEAFPIMLGVFAVGLAIGTMGSMLVAESTRTEPVHEVAEKAKHFKNKAARALS